MSMISFRNFLAPFTSKVQIGALLVLAFLAFVFRLGSQSDGGGAHHAPKAELSAEQESDPLADSLQAMMADQQRKFDALQPQRVAAPPSRDPLLDDIVAGRVAPPKRPESDQEVDAEAPARPLGDIKKSLGLE